MLAASADCFVLVMVKLQLRIPPQIVKICYRDMIDTVDSLKNMLELRFAEEQEQTTFAHAQQLQAAKMELDRAMDLIRQKVRSSFSIYFEIEYKGTFNTYKVILLCLCDYNLLYKLILLINAANLKFYKSFLGHLH